MDGMKMDHPALEQGDRARVRIFRNNPEKDMDKNEIIDLVKAAISVNPKYLKKRDQSNFIEKISLPSVIIESGRK